MNVNYSVTPVTPPVVREVATQAKAEGKTIVLVTGVFDLLHQEHKNFLQKAKAAGDVLIVAIESDARVQQMKGPGRPVHTAAVRLAALDELGVIDAVFVLPDNFKKPEQRRQLLEDIKPDVLAVSSHTDHLEIKQQMMAEIGGRVEVVHQHNPEVSTTKLLEQA